MAYKVKIDAPQFELGKPDVVFEVKHNGKALGKLKVSKGRVEWMERNDKTKAYELGWTEFDAFFRKVGKKTKTRS